MSSAQISRDFPFLQASPEDIEKNKKDTKAFNKRVDDYNTRHPDQEPQKHHEDGGAGAPTDDQGNEI